jgi:hypothetical protein
MNDHDPITFPGPLLGRSGYRALHSFMVDALMEATREVRLAVIDLAGGISSGHLILAVNDRRLRARVEIEADGMPWVWLEYRTPDKYLPIVAVAVTELGLHPSTVLREQDMRMEDALREILAGDE